MSLSIFLEERSEECNELHKLECRECGRVYDYRQQNDLFNANITHNLGSMADALGIYYLVWRPEEIGIKKASELIFPLTLAIDNMRRRPEIYRKFDDAAGWGTYDQFLPWLETYRTACQKYPDAFVRVSR